MKTRSIVLLMCCLVSLSSMSCKHRQCVPDIVKETVYIHDTTYCHDTVYLKKIKIDTIVIRTHDTLVIPDKNFCRTAYPVYISETRIKEKYSNYIGFNASTNFNRFSVGVSSGFGYKNMQFSSSLKINSRMQPTYSIGFKYNF